MQGYWIESSSDRIDTAIKKPLFIVIFDVFITKKFHTKMESLRGKEEKEGFFSRGNNFLNYYIKKKEISSFSFTSVKLYAKLKIST